MNEKEGCAPRKIRLCNQFDVNWMTHTCESFCQSKFGEDAELCIDMDQGLAS